MFKPILVGDWMPEFQRVCFDHLADGRLSLVEHFQWLTRPEQGINTFEEISSEKIQKSNGA